jgi:hypothetical protein
MGEAVKDWRMVRTLARRIVNRFHLPYFSFTPTFSICPVHGYISGEHGLSPHPHTDHEIELFGEEVMCAEPLPEEATGDDRADEKARQAAVSEHDKWSCDGKSEGGQDRDLLQVVGYYRPVQDWNAENREFNWGVR